MQNFPEGVKFGYNSTTNNYGNEFGVGHTVEFSASNRFRNHFPVFTNCSWNMVYCWVKFEFLPAEFSTFSIVAQQPEKLWTNGDHKHIQSIT